MLHAVSLKIVLIHDALTAFSFICSIIGKNKRERKLWSNYCYSTYQIQTKDTVCNLVCAKVQNYHTYLLTFGEGLYFVNKLGPNFMCIKLPSIAQCSFDYSMYSFRFFQHEACQEYTVRQNIPKILTIGGGWASLCSTKNAIVYTRMLYRCAIRLNDEKLLRKSILFLARNFLWSGAVRKSRMMFSTLQRLASQANDHDLQALCEIGITDCSRLRPKKEKKKCIGNE